MNSEIYDKLYKDNPESWTGRHEVDYAIKEIVDEYKGNIKLIDLGCGNGRTIEVIKKKNIDIIGVDFSNEALTLAHNTNPDIEFVKCDMTDTPYEDNSFDIVLSVGSHEHLKEIDFSEPYRLVNDDGCFICVVPVSDKDKGWVNVNGQHEWKLPFSKWSDLLVEAGFREISYYKGVFTCKII